MSMMMFLSEWHGDHRDLNRRRHSFPTRRSSDLVQVEGTLVDGTKLVSVHEPIRHSGLDPKLALYASGLIKSKDRIVTDNSMNLIPGQVELSDTPIIINEGRNTISMDVTNKGSRPIQIGSHCNFAETNKALCFDRLVAVGYRLNIPAGTAVRFEPGETKHVELDRKSVV